MNIMVINVPNKSENTRNRYLTYLKEETDTKGFYSFIKSKKQT